MFDKLKEIEERYNEIENELAKPEVIANMDVYKRLGKEYADLREFVDLYREWKRKKEQEVDTLSMLESESDEEMKALIKEEAHHLVSELERIESDTRERLLRRHEKKVNSMFLEIRAGTGGEEAALFAGDLFAMYMKYAEKMKWKSELMTASISDLGGFKEVVMVVEGRDAYNQLRFESGVHRVQRVPVTETQGRVHTSAVTVAVLPEPEETEIHIAAEDLRIDVFRSSGPGGQHVNTTDSAVRVTHTPTGMVVTCQDEKSQHKNKAKAIRVLRARLKEKIEAEQEQEISEERKKQVGTGDRSERIRTYNFPQGRISDHRIGLTLYKLESVLDGSLEDIINPLVAHYQSESLKAG